MKKSILAILMLVVVSSFVVAIPTEKDLPSDVWKGGDWVRFQPQMSIQEHNIKYFGGRTHTEVIQELYEVPKMLERDKVVKRVNARVKVVGGIITLLVSGEDECKSNGLEYCSVFYDDKNEQKCKRNVIARCSYLQPSYN